MQTHWQAQFFNQYVLSGEIIQLVLAMQYEESIRKKNPKSQTPYYQDDKFEQIKNFIKGPGIFEDLD